MELPEWNAWWKREGRDQLVRLLLTEWDPIGVKHEVQAADEYETYADELGRMLRSGSPPEEIARRLREVEISSMGLADGPADDLLPVARKLRTWHDAAAS